MTLTNHTLYHILTDKHQQTLTLYLYTTITNFITFAITYVLGGPLHWLTFVEVYSLRMSVNHFDTQYMNF